MKSLWPSQGLYAITPDGTPPATLIPQVEAALSAGIAALQYREKTQPWPVRLRTARALREMCQSAGVPLIINDDLTLALEAEADGVHLGRDELHLLPTAVATPPGLLVGVSCYNELQRGRDAVAGGADYIAFGSVFDSRTKPAAVHCALSVLEAARVEFTLPLVAIGGITVKNAASALAAGAHLLAVVSGIFGAGDVGAAVRALRKSFPVN